MAVSWAMANLVLLFQQQESLTIFSEMVKIIVPGLAIVSSFISLTALIVLLRYRVDILEKAREKVEKEVTSLTEELQVSFRQAAADLNLATSNFKVVAAEQAVVNKMTAQALDAILTRVEQNNKMVNDHGTMLAIISTELKTLEAGKRDKE